jgi:hypoxanthine-DNA glycosylase
MTTPSARSQSFPPVAGPETRLLVLGSLPGQESLARRQYYAHPRNLFWRLMEGVIGAPLVALDYAARLARLVAAGVGLWDSVGSAVRPGSLDSAIRDHDPNPVAALAATLPQLRAIAFNGAASFKLGAPHLGHLGLPLIRLPSSSPAHAAMPFAEKQAAWAALAAYLA